jgi:integrase
MRVFRTSYKDKDGIKRTAQKWYIELRDHLAIVRRLPAFTDKGQSEALGRQIQKLINFKVAGETPDAQLSKWLEQIPTKLKNHFVRIGLLDAQRAAGGKPLTEHLKDFEQSLVAQGFVKKHIEVVVTRAAKVIEGCKFFVYGDISASMVERYLIELRQRKNVAAATHNYYLKAAKQFCRWMMQNRRASENPLQYLKGLNARIDIRHNRRPLSTDEVRRLLEKTQTEPERLGMSGHERALLYRLAVETGLRAGELRSLTVSSFDLEGLTVTLEAAFSKHRKQDRLPLRPDTAIALQGFLCGKMPNVRVFDLHIRTADMLKADLKAAGIAYQDEAGRYADFHSLRHTTGSLLAASGTHPKVAQSLMRHGDINLTMSRYTHIFRGQESKAVESLPDLSLPSAQTQRAIMTGTDGGKNLAENLALHAEGNRILPNAGEQTNHIVDNKNTFLNQNHDSHIARMAGASC